MYDTRIASYRHWGARNAGLLRVGLLALDGRNAKLAGGLPSGPILSGLSRTEGLKASLNWFKVLISLFNLRTFIRTSSPYSKEGNLQNVAGTLLLYSFILDDQVQRYTVPALKDLRVALPDL